MARPKKTEQEPAAAPPAAATTATAAIASNDSSLLKTSDLLWMRDKFISGLSNLESGVHELRRAYISHFNTLLPEGHPGRLSLPFFTSFDNNAAGPLGNRGETPAGGATEANMKRKRKPHDPNAPKRALTSYFLFMQHNKPEIKNAHADWTAQQISEESERRWTNISDVEKANYEYMYQVDLARYYRQKECYERGEPVPDIDPEEAKRLYQEHLKSGVPFKGRKGKKDGFPNLPAAAAAADDTSGSSDEEEEQAPPPKSKRQKVAEPAATKAPKAPAKTAAMKAKAAAEAAAVMESPKPKKKAGRKSKGAEVEEPEPTPASAKKDKKAGRKRKSTAGDD